MKKLSLRYVIVLCLTCCLSITTFAQSVSFKVRNVTVKTAVLKLKKTTGYSFVFGSSKVNTQKRISVDAHNQPKDVVDQISLNLNLKHNDGCEEADADK